MSGVTSLCEGSGKIDNLSFIWRFTTPAAPGFDPLSKLELPELG